VMISARACRVVISWSMGLLPLPGRSSGGDLLHRPRRQAGRVAAGHPAHRLGQLTLFCPRPGNCQLIPAGTSVRIRRQAKERQRLAQQAHPGLPPCCEPAGGAVSLEHRMCPGSRDQRDPETRSFRAKHNANMFSQRVNTAVGGGCQRRRCGSRWCCQRDNERAIAYLGRRG
jgi:hypothetical protein